MTSMTTMTTCVNYDKFGRVPPAFVVPGGRRAGPEGLQREAAQVPRGYRGRRAGPEGVQREAKVPRGIRQLV